MRYLFHFEQFVFALLVFSIPFQTRVLLFDGGGTFNEWNSGFFYITDAFAFTLFTVWILRIARINGGPFRKGPSFGVGLSLAVFLSVSAISLFSAEYKETALYQLLKLGEFILLFWYIASSRKYIDMRTISFVWVLSAILQSVVAISQFISQSSIGLTHIEAGLLGPSIAGVAKITVEGIKLIRGYGTFPHPNALGAFLMIGIFSFYYFILNQPIERHFRKLSFFVRRTLFASVVSLVLFGGLFVSFSRAVIAITLLGSLCFLVTVIFVKKLRQYYEREIWYLMSLLIATLILLTFFMAPFLSARFSIERGEQAVESRITDYPHALSLIKEKPILGLGPGGYVSHLMNTVPDLPSWRYEPLHNIYLFIAVETGLLGLCTFLIFLFLVARQALRNYLSAVSPEKQLVVLIHLVILGSIVILFATDHYFWSLQQGRLLFWAVLGTAVLGTDPVKIKGPLVRSFLKKLLFNGVGRFLRGQIH